MTFFIFNIKNIYFSVFNFFDICYKIYIFLPRHQHGSHRYKIHRHFKLFISHHIIAFNNCYLMNKPIHISLSMHQSYFVTDPNLDYITLSDPNSVVFLWSNQIWSHDPAWAIILDVALAQSVFKSDIEPDQMTRDPSILDSVNPASGPSRIRLLDFAC